MPADAPTILATSMGLNRARDPWQPGPVFDYACELARPAGTPKLCVVATAGGDQRDTLDHFEAAFADRPVELSHLALFDKPNLDDVAAHRKAAVVDQELCEPFDGIFGQHYRLYSSDGATRSYHRRSLPDMERAIMPVGNDGSDLSLSLTEALGLTSEVRGSSTAVMVELRGIEPLTFSMRTRRATNCATAPGKA